MVDSNINTNNDNYSSSNENISVTPDFISRKLAFLIKSFGYDEECEYYWTSRGLEPYTDGKCRNYNKEHGTSNAYLLTEAYRWLRENYKYDLVIYRNTLLGRDNYTCNILNESLSRIASISKDTYEEAFDEGMCETLNYIKSKKELIDEFLKVLPLEWLSGKEDLEITQRNIINLFENHGYDICITENISFCEWSLSIVLDNGNYCSLYKSLKKSFETPEEALIDVIKFIGNYKIIKKD